MTLKDVEKLVLKVTSEPNNSTAAAIARSIHRDLERGVSPTVYWENYLRSYASIARIKIDDVPNIDPEFGPVSP